MTVTLLLIVAELIAVIIGAEMVVHGAARIANRLHVSEYLIGVLIVGFGTSLPELVVSLSGVWEGNPDVCVGNIVGSNIFNILAILGLTAIIMPIGFTATNRAIDLPLTVLITFFGLILCMSGGIIGRGEGAAMLVLFCSFVLWSMAGGQEKEPIVMPETCRTVLPPMLWRSSGWAMFGLCMLVLVGLGMLVCGGYWLVRHSVQMAEMIGMSDRWVAIMVLAMGTSLPELVTSVAAARRGMAQMALGNILGSNAFNILFILGLSAVIQPLEVGGMCMEDWLGMALSVVLLYVFSLQRPPRIERWHGAWMVLLMVLYVMLLFKV